MAKNQHVLPAWGEHVAWLREALVNRTYVHTTDAIREIGWWRMGAGIHCLRRRGWAIDMEMVSDPQTGRRTGRYQLLSMPEKEAA